MEKGWCKFIPVDFSIGTCSDFVLDPISVFPPIVQNHRKRLPADNNSAGDDRRPGICTMHFDGCIKLGFLLLISFCGLLLPSSSVNDYIPVETRQFGKIITGKDQQFYRAGLVCRSIGTNRMYIYESEPPEEAQLKVSSRKFSYYLELWSWMSSTVS